MQMLILILPAQMHQNGFINILLIRVPTSNSKNIKLMQPCPVEL